METTELITQLTRLGFGAIATFFAIVLWSNTRDGAWMFVIIGTIIHYGEIMYTTFQLFGILQREITLFGVPFVRLLLTNLPALFFAVAFIMVIARSRIR